MTPATPDGSALVALGTRPGQQWQVNRGWVDMTRSAPAVQRVELPWGDRRIAFDLAKTALIVIDMQNDFCHPQGWLAGIGVDVAPARAPIAPLARLLPQLRAYEVPVVWLNWGNRPDRANVPPSNLHVYNPDGVSTGIGDPLPNAPVPGARVLQKDSWAAAVVEELPVGPTDIRVDKYRMSGFPDTPLDSILRNLGARTLLFAGVNADQCVLATLMDANFAGYDCLLLSECTATTSPGYCWDATVYNVNTCFGCVVSSEALLTALASQPR
jgi:nicotinamidase-related amidase